MNKSEFHSNRKKNLTKEYAELKEAKKGQSESFNILAAKHGISSSTVRHIIFNKTYNQKTT